MNADHERAHAYDAWQRSYDRRQRQLNTALWAVLIITPAVALVGLYVVKSALGVDVFPDMHAADVLQLFSPFRTY